MSCCSPLGSGPAELDPDDPPALFIPMFGVSRLLAFSASQIGVSSNVAPKYEWTYPGGIQVQTFAVGPDGALYHPSTGIAGIARYPLRGSGELRRYPLSDLNGVANLGFTGAFYAQAPASGVDAWAYISGTGSASSYYRWGADVMQSFSQPAWANADSFTGFISSNDCAFDENANLWVTDGTSGVVRYSGLIGGPGAAVVDVFLQGTNWTSGAGSNQHVAVARNGDFYITRYVFGSTGPVRVADAALVASLVGAGASNPVPSRTFTIIGFPGLEGCAFDYSGNLWLCSYDSPRVGCVLAADLTTSGAKTPAIVLTGGGRLGDGNATGPLGPRFAKGFGPNR
jgi:hypothetical protein